jgi:hypothetical protein
MTQVPGYPTPSWLVHVRTYAVEEIMMFMFLFTRRLCLQYCIQGFKRLWPYRRQQRFLAWCTIPIYYYYYYYYYYYEAEEEEPSLTPPPL